MGYALFAARKIMLTDRVNDYQMKLTQVMDQMNAYSDIALAVGDGDVSSADLAMCQSLGMGLAYRSELNTGVALSHLTPEYVATRAIAEGDADRALGGSRVGNIACGGATGGLAGAAIGFFASGCNPIGAIVGGVLGAITGGTAAHAASPRSQAKQEQINQTIENMDEEQRKQMASDLAREIAQIENQLEKHKQQLETKLQRAESELESVKQGEEKGIQNATPKYTSGR